MITINKKPVAATGVTVENEPIIKSDGAGEVMQWQPSDGAADGVFITEDSAGDALRLGVGTDSPEAALDVSSTVSGGAGTVYGAIIRGTEAVGADLEIGDGIGLKFEIPNNHSESRIGASIEAIKESGGDDSSRTSLLFKTSQDDETLDTALTIDSAGQVQVGTVHANEDQTSSLIISKSITASATHDFITLSDTANNGSEKLRLLFKGRYATSSHSSGQEAAYISCNRDSGSDGYGLSFGTGDGADAVDRLTISRTGLCSFSAGIVTSEKGIISGSVTVADDAVTTITPQRKGGFLMLSADSTAGDGATPQTAYCRQIYFDCGSSLGILFTTTDATTNIGANFELSTSDVTGTTGSDNRATVAVQTDVIKIENRSGGTKTFNYTIIS